MKRHPSLPLCLALLFGLLNLTVLAQTEPLKRVTILADFSDRGQFEVENRLFQALDKMGVETPVVINIGQADGQALLGSWGLTPADLPILALTVTAPEKSHPTLIWYWKVESVPAAIQALQAELGVEPVAALPVIRAADFSPKGMPLQAGAALRIMVQGTPGCSATADVGGAAGIPLFEMESGLYQGEYRVKPDDRTDAGITVKLTSDSGAGASRFVGHVLLQGLQAPSLQSVREVSPGEWLLAGTAPPNSRVSVEAVVTQTLIFKFRSKLDFNGMADASGQFQLRANSPDNIGGSEGDFTATAALGAHSETTVGRLKFQGQARSYQPGNSNTAFNPWSLAGRWFRQNKPVSIRVHGFDTVVIRNEYGQETTLVLVQPNKLVSRDNGQLSGRLNGNTILWNNGTMWTRSSF